MVLWSCQAELSGAMVDTKIALEMLYDDEFASESSDAQGFVVRHMLQVMNHFLTRIIEYQ